MSERPSKSARKREHLALQALGEKLIGLPEQTLRDMQRTLATEYARWLRFGEQQKLYHDRLLREAGDNAEAAVNAYQSGLNEFTTLMRARITELDVRLQDIRIRVLEQTQLPQFDPAAVQVRLLDLLPYLPLWYEEQVCAVRDNIEGYRLAPDGNYDALREVHRK